jgi:hypothetical protein
LFRVTSRKEARSVFYANRDVGIEPVFDRGPGLRPMNTKENIEKVAHLFPQSQEVPKNGLALNVCQKENGLSRTSSPPTSRCHARDPARHRRAVISISTSLFGRE